MINTWKDGVTQFNGNSITYNAAGNPTSYLGHLMTWSIGRLMSANYGGNITFAYDHNGLRTEKNSSQGNIRYYYSGTQLVKQTDGTKRRISITELTAGLMPQSIKEQLNENIRPLIRSKSL